MALLWPLPARCPLTHLPRDPCPTFPPRDSFQRAAALSSARRGDLAFLPQRSAVPQAARRGAIPCICSAGKKILVFISKFTLGNTPGQPSNPKFPSWGGRARSVPVPCPCASSPPWARAAPLPLQHSHPEGFQELRGWKSPSSARNPAGSLLSKPRSTPSFGRNQLQSLGLIEVGDRRRMYSCGWCSPLLAAMETELTKNKKYSHKCQNTPCFRDVRRIGPAICSRYATAFTVSLITWDKLAPGWVFCII